MRARGGDLTKESISSVGDLIEYLCSGVGTFGLFGRETGAKTKRGYLVSSFLSLEWAWVSEKVSFLTDIYLLLHRPSSLKKAVFRTFLL